ISGHCESAAPSRGACGPIRPDGHPSSRCPSPREHPDWGLVLPIDDRSVAPDVPPLEIIPLGGLGEFGMNMMVIACGDTAILVDAGVMFPEPELLGVDLVVPDLRQLEKYPIRALVLTHGHE